MEDNHGEGTISKRLRIRMYKPKKKADSNALSVASAASISSGGLGMYMSSQFRRKTKNSVKDDSSSSNLSYRAVKSSKSSLLAHPGPRSSALVPEAQTTIGPTMSPSESSSILDNLTRTPAAAPKSNKLTSIASPSALQLLAAAPEEYLSTSKPSSAAHSFIQEQDTQRIKRSFNWNDRLHNIDRILEIGKTVGGVAGIVSAPLKAAFGITQQFVKMAQEVLQNKEEAKELVEKLNGILLHLEQLERNFRHSPLGSAHVTELGLYESLQAYTLALREIGLELDQLLKDEENKVKKALGSIFMAKSTQEFLKSCVRKLDNSFQQFMVSINALTAANTRELLARDALNKLSIAKPTKHHEMCLPRTRTVILSEIRQWASNPESKPIFALVDQAGTGKSTIANTMIQEWSGVGRLGARFYFTRPSIVTATDLASSLSKGVADKVLYIRHHVVAAFSENSDFVNDAVPIQLEKLLFTPLRKGKAELSEALDGVKREKCVKAGLETLEKRPKYMGDEAKVQKALRAYLNALGKARVGHLGESECKELNEAYMEYLDTMEESLFNAFQNPPIIVIDALDECTKEERCIVLQSLLHSVSDTHAYKLLLTCRPEADIHSELQEHNDVICRSAHPLLSETHLPEQDISIYATKYLGTILDTAQIKQFVTRANGLFIWASTARAYLNSAKSNKWKLHSRFGMLIKTGPHASALYDLYQQVLLSATPDQEVLFIW